MKKFSFEVENYDGGNNMDKERLLKEIMSWYNYNYKIEGKKIVIDNGITDYGLNFVGVSVNCGHFEYGSIDEALKDWLPTLEQTNEDDVVWHKREIDFIKSL